LNIAASEGRGGRGEELIRSMPSSLERDAGGVTAIVAAPANSAAATAIFKHVDIEVTASLDLLHRYLTMYARQYLGKRSAR
jgi:hypothetical protein